MLDQDTVTVFPNVVNGMQAYSITPGDERSLFNVTKEESFIGAVTDALEVDRLEVIPTGGDKFEAAREQWDDGNNVVALRPGVVIAYTTGTPARTGTSGTRGLKCWSSKGESLAADMAGRIA